MKYSLGIFNSREEISSLSHSESAKNVNRKTIQKDLHDPDHHDDVITHLEPDILECEVKQALGSITMNEAIGGYGIPVELFQI